MSRQLNAYFNDKDCKVYKEFNGYLGTDGYRGMLTETN